ncbi:MAG TPA: hypothetical protein VGN57_09850 [Pirellulaceae bacterium]|jgi:hypothetical protein|nr:hypothetical protein [Pirellulaceae bacterium]
MPRPRFRLRTLLILMVAASILLGWFVAVWKGAQALGFIFPTDAVYLTVESPRNDLDVVALFAVQDDRATPIRPYIYMFYWFTIDGMTDLTATNTDLSRKPAAWLYTDRYLLVARDQKGDWHRWSFPAAGNVRVVWSPTGSIASVGVPEGAALDQPTREELLGLGIDEWTIDRAY